MSGHMFGQRLFGSRYVFPASGTRTGPLNWIKKAREFNALQEYNCILLLITLRVNYIATRFALYELRLNQFALPGLEQASSPRTSRLSPWRHPNL